MRKKIWVNTIVYNEDQFIWFALSSVINWVDKILIYDSGSIDKSVKIIKDLQKKYQTKIIFKEVGLVDKNKFSKMRQKMIDESKGDWILVLDGDEVWPEESIKEIIETIDKKGEMLDAIITPFYNLVGDIYHYQPEVAGEYEILGKRGHLTIRAFSKKIPGLHVENPYGSEGYFDGDGTPIQKRDPQRLLFLNTPYLHFTHLKRSSMDQKQNKYKYELGKLFPRDFIYPSVLYQSHPENVPSPWNRRTFEVTFKSFLRHPLISFWRRIKKVI